MEYKTASEYNSENNLYHIVFPMIYLFMLYKSTGYYSNSLIVFYFIKTIILIAFGLPELSKDIPLPPEDQDDVTFENGIAKSEAYTQWKDASSSAKPNLLIPLNTEFSESDYIILDIFKSIKLNFKYRAQYLKIQEENPNIYLGLSEYITAKKRAQFYGNYTIRGIITLGDCVLIIILVSLALSNISTWLYADGNKIYSIFGGRDRLNPINLLKEYESKDNNTLSNLKYSYGFVITGCRDEYNTNLVRHNIDSNNNLTKYFSYTSITTPFWSYIEHQLYFIVIFLGLLMAINYYTSDDRENIMLIGVYACLLVARLVSVILTFQNFSVDTEGFEWVVYSVFPFLDFTIVCVLIGLLIELFRKINILVWVVCIFYIICGMDSHLVILL